MQNTADTERLQALKDKVWEEFCFQCCRSGNHTLPFDSLGRKLNQKFPEWTEGLEWLIAEGKLKLSGSQEINVSLGENVIPDEFEQKILLKLSAWAC